MIRNKRPNKIDPLELLREFTINKKDVVKKDQYLFFDQTKLELKTPTAWKKNTGGYYTLGDLWLFNQKVQQNMSMKHYFNQRQSFALEGIDKIDEDEISNYLQGKIDNSDKIDQEAKQQLLSSRKSKPAESSALEGSLTKKIKTNDGEAKTVEMQQREEYLNAISWIMKTEKPLTSRTRMLRSKFNSNINFKHYIKQLDEGKMTTQNNPLEIKSTINYPCLFKDLRDKGLKPIIVVPTMGRTGNISLFNAKKFLAEGKYEDPENKDSDNSERVIQIEKNIKGHNFLFEVYDNVGTFESKNNPSQKSKWERVVGVFVSGQKYQFKGWPKEDNIPSILDQVKGFYLKYYDIPTPDQVANWNVKIVSVYRNKRHLDFPAYEQFWQELENFMIQPRNKQK
ncbi:RNA pol II accessory factor, Cdc73 family protein (macronuclear) [Tetrahymena thermophila SB210]|uniref:RNA pol II accessory factor, Cdc73 family protein n=1 Tax=Tetrahymena thermophila (strain SB210) TaxID=312017 RepID=I7M611_TETTS|nr:RNA pol II accessory factor, Cdc73 family protein [Tetrahymena thermophila SB210]EAR84002.1 RNA pol II accessory factor, Cdc73 family protein [Tetrahymena thermophila SB210]|eukprot:XP_001031665.1 RNA pol II accessory factor, Cdc73 family protein [Tetrahymena thermophila SB210]